MQIVRCTDAALPAIPARWCSRDTVTRKGASQTRLRSDAASRRSSIAPRRRCSLLLTTAATTDAAFEVPLVFEVTERAWEPLQTATVEIAIAIAGTYLFLKVFQFLSSRYLEEKWTTELAPDSRVKRSKTMTAAMLQALQSPVSVFLPFATVLRCIRVLTCRLKQSMAICTTCPHKSLERRLEVFLDLILRVLEPVDDILHLVIKETLLLATVWCLVTFKDRYVAWSLEQQSRNSPALLQDYKRIIVPVNTLLTWLIAGLGLITGMGLAGIDIRPILTIGGIGSAIVGLGSQSVLANMIAGINLFLARPFVAGDRVQIFNSLGKLTYSGLVERVNPLRTVIRTDANYPVTVPNKLLSEMVIGNESRYPTMPALPVESSRRIQMTLTLDTTQFDKLDDVVSLIRTTLESFEGLNRGIPISTNIDAISAAEVTIDIQATALKRASVHFNDLRVRLLRAVREQLEQQGIAGYKLTFGSPL